MFAPAPRHSEVLVLRNGIQALPQFDSNLTVKTDLPLLFRINCAFLSNKFPDGGSLGFLPAHLWDTASLLLETPLPSSFTPTPQPCSKDHPKYYLLDEASLKLPSCNQVDFLCQIRFCYLRPLFCEHPWGVSSFGKHVLGILVTLPALVRMSRTS